MPRNNPASPPVTGGVIRCTTQISSQNQIYEVILDYMATTAGAISVTTLNSFLSTFRANVETALRNVLTTTTNILAYMAQEVAIAMLPPQTLPPLTPAGLVTGAQLNGILAAVVTKTSALRGQHGRGRYFGPALPASFASAADPNALSAAGIAAYNTLNTALLTAIVIGALTFAMSISTRPIAPLTKVANGVPVASLIVQSLMGTVRRRKEGRGI